MENEPPHTRRKVDPQEIRILLSALRVEATPEAHFEERFLYDFRERLAHEAVCRPARTLLWEHLLMLLDNLGGRRLALGASSFGLGALFIGLLTWETTPVPQAIAAHMCELEKSAAALRPGSSHDVVCTSVTRGKRRAYTESSIAMQANDASYSVDAIDDYDPSSSYANPTSAWEESGNLGLPGLSPAFAN